MLSVPDRDIWTGFFSQSSISDSNVEIFANDGTFLIDKANIGSFAGTSKNSYVCEVAPTDTFNMVVLGWKFLSSSTKTVLSTINNVVKVRYTVENVATTTCKVLMITACEIDSKTNTAEIRLESLMLQANIVTGADNTRTWFEREQLLAVSKAQGIRLTGVAYNTSCSFYYDSVQSGFRGTTLEHISIDNILVNGAVDFPTINIKDDWKYTTEENKADVVIYGREAGTVVELTSQTKTGYDTFFNFYFSREVYLDHFDEFGRVSGSASFQTVATDLTSWIIVGSTGATVLFPYQLGGYVAGMVKVYGYDVVMSAVPSEITTHYLQTPYLISGSAELTSIQRQLRTYYSNNRIASFSCRFDPTIEPLDVISIDGVWIAVEQVDITFNGGFMGKVIGRKLVNFNFIAPVVVSLDANNYEFVLENPNGFEVTAMLQTSQDEFELGTISANDSETFYADDLGSHATSFFDDFANGVLEEDVAVHFTIQGKRSNDTILLDNGYTLVAPVITQFTYDDSQLRPTQYTLRIRNDNPFSVRLYVSASQDSEYSITVNANSTAVITQTQFPKMLDLIYCYNTSTLFNDTIAYFTYPNSATSSSTVILLERS